MTLGENLGSGGKSDRRWYSDIWTHYIVGGHFDDWHPDVFKELRSGSDCRVHSLHWDSVLSASTE